MLIDIHKYACKYRYLYIFLCFRYFFLFFGGYHVTVILMMVICERSISERSICETSICLKF